MSLKILFFIGLFLAAGWHISYSAVSQLEIWSHLKELQVEFSESDRDRIIDIDFQKRIAEKLIAEYDEPEDREYLERAFNELFTATLALFDIYDHYCRTARDGLPEIFQPELDRPVGLERRALEKLEKAGLLKDKAASTENFESAKKIYKVAFDLEQLALLHKARALVIYQDFPVIYAYQWETDYTILEVSPERIVRVVENDHETGEGLEPEHPGSRGDHEEPGHIEAPAGSREGAAEEAEPVELHPGQQPGEGINWIIQIAAHISEIPENELRRIYGGDRPVKFMVEDGWHKYYLGPYRSYEEANNVLESLTPGSAFLAAYLNGRRISAGEARRRQAAGE